MIRTPMAAPPVRSLPVRAALAAALLLGGCAAPEPAAPPNVLILVIDALRPDHLGCYGYGRPTSPAIDALARRGVLFADATSPASYTRAAVPSIFTSVHPGAHGVLSQGRNVEVLSDDYLTLAEILRERGYRTAAWMPNPSLHRTFNFGQGFDLYDDDFPNDRLGDPDSHETAKKLRRRALPWLRREPGRPWLAYLHYRDVHAPWAPPPPYDRMFAPADAPAEGWVDVPKERLPEDAAMYRALYDGDLRYTDDQLGRFLGELERAGLLANTAVFLTSDHGEAFHEHGTWTHGNGLYEEEVRVPLIAVLPDGAHAGTRVTAPVQTTDIYPTVLELLGVEPPEQVQGRSLLRTLAEPDPERAVFAEARVTKRGRETSGTQLVAVRRGGWKLIYNRDRREGELYHLAVDPGETRDLVATERDRARELHRLLRAFDAANARQARWRAGQEGLPGDVVEGLRSLGYIE